MECLKRPLLTECLDLVNILIATIIPLPRLSLRIFVRQARPHCFHDRLRSIVFTRNQLQTRQLPLLLLLYQYIHLRIRICQPRIFHGQRLLPNGNLGHAVIIRRLHSLFLVFELKEFDQFFVVVELEHI